MSINLQTLKGASKCTWPHISRTNHTSYSIVECRAWKGSVAHQTQAHVTQPLQSYCTGISISVWNVNNFKNLTENTRAQPNKEYEKLKIENSTTWQFYSFDILPFIYIYIYKFIYFLYTYIFSCNHIYTCLEFVHIYFELYIFILSGQKRTAHLTK